MKAISTQTEYITTASLFTTILVFGCLALVGEEPIVEQLSTVLDSVWKLLFFLYDQDVVQAKETQRSAELDSLLLLLTKHNPGKQLNPVSFYQLLVLQTEL